MACAAIRVGAPASPPQPTPTLLPRVWHGGQHGRSPRVFVPRFIPLLGAVWTRIGFSTLFPGTDWVQHPFHRADLFSAGRRCQHAAWVSPSPTSFTPASCPVAPVLISPSSFIFFIYPSSLYIFVLIYPRFVLMSPVDKRFIPQRD